MAMTAVRHHYHRLREHQQTVYAGGGGTLTTYPSGRTEFSYASAPYGEHALSAYRGARAHVAFLDRLKGYVGKRARA